jgi:hypothetical protein
MPVRIDAQRLAFHPPWSFAQQTLLAAVDQPGEASFVLAIHHNKPSLFPEAKTVHLACL